MTFREYGYYIFEVGVLCKVPFHFSFAVALALLSTSFPSKIRSFMCGPLPVTRRI